MVGLVNLLVTKIRCCFPIHVTFITVKDFFRSFLLRKAPDGLPHFSGFKDMIDGQFIKKLNSISVADTPASPLCTLSSWMKERS